MQQCIITLEEMEVFPMAYDADKIIQIATQLKEAREEVTRLESELRKLVLSQTTPVSLVVQQSTANRVVSMMNTEPTRDFGAEDVWKKLQIKESYARPLLSRLVTSGKIEKRGYGTYGAVGGRKQKSLESVDSRPVQ
jgi:hypothetical protein